MDQAGEINLAYEHTLEGWARILEMRDKTTESHSRRVTILTLQLARQFGITGTELTHIRRGVLLHDIGKLAIPDQILKRKDRWIMKSGMKCEDILNMLMSSYIQ